MSVYPAPHDDAGNVEDLLSQLVQPSSRDISAGSDATSPIAGAEVGRTLKEPPLPIDVATPNGAESLPNGGVWRQNGSEILPNGGVWRHQTGLPTGASFVATPSPALSKSTRFINRDGMLLSREDEGITAASWWLPALWRILSVSTLPCASTPCVGIWALRAHKEARLWGVQAP